MNAKLYNTSATLAAVTFFAALLTACGPQKHENAAQETLSHGGKHGIRAACAEDIQKFCASADKKRRCLRENIDKLSDNCKAAVAQRRNRGGGNRDNDDQQ
jgi:hypothetical protein